MVSLSTFSFAMTKGKDERFVESSESIRLDLQTATFVQEDLQQKHPSEYTVSGLEEFLASGSGSLVLMGTGEENGQKVDVRKTMTVRENILTILKETHLPGQSFVFRNCYSFQRNGTRRP